MANVFVVVGYLAAVASVVAVPADADADDDARSVVCSLLKQVLLLRRGQGIDVQLLSMVIVDVIVRLVFSSAMRMRMRNYRRNQ